MNHEDMKQSLIEEGKKLGLKGNDLRFHPTDFIDKRKIEIICPECGEKIRNSGFSYHKKSHLSTEQKQEAIKLYIQDKGTLYSTVKKLHKSQYQISRTITDAGYKLRTITEYNLLSYQKGRIPSTPFGVNAPHWKNGKSIDTDGYILVNIGPNSNVSDYIPEHRLVWEQVNNKKLPKGWLVHHLNGIKTDNRPENLIAMSRSDHARRHFGSEYQKRIRELENKVDLLEKMLEEQKISMEVE